MQEHDLDYLVDAPKRKRKKIHSQWASLRINHCQWHPDDDYLLINSVLHLMNISYVYYGVKFSKPYQEKEIEKRWKELLFNESRSGLALEAIRNISIYDKDILDRKIPFNETENQKLNKISFNDVYSSQGSMFPSNPSLEPFKNILKEDRYSTFFRNRTAEQLFRAWSILRKHINESVKLGGNPHKFEDVDMLIRRMHDNPIVTSTYSSDIHGDYKSFQRMFAQKQQKIIVADIVPVVSVNPPNLSISPSNSTISDNTSTPATSAAAAGTATTLINSTTISTGTVNSKPHIPPSRPLSTRSSSLEDQLLVHEMMESDKDNRRRIYGKLRKVGEEARRWTCLVEAVTGKPITDRQGNNSLATLTGIRSRFLIKEREATFGRKTSTVKPDMDLSLEGPANRISRLQGCIKLNESGEFSLVNWDKEPVFVDGSVVLIGEELILMNNAMITISGLTFRFNINDCLLNNYLEYDGDNNCINNNNKSIINNGNNEDDCKEFNEDDNDLMLFTNSRYNIKQELNEFTSHQHQHHQQQLLLHQQQQHLHHHQNNMDIVDEPVNVAASLIDPHQPHQITLTSLPNTNQVQYTRLLYSNLDSGSIAYSNNRSGPTTSSSSLQQSSINMELNDVNSRVTIDQTRRKQILK